MNRGANMSTLTQLTGYVDEFLFVSAENLKMPELIQFVRGRTMSIARDDIY